MPEALWGFIGGNVFVRTLNRLRDRRIYAMRRMK